MQAASSLVGTEVLLGVIPGGTGNLLAGNLRIPTSPVRATREMLAGRAQALRPRPHGAARRHTLLRGGVRRGIRRARHGRHAGRAQAALGHGAYVATTLRLIGEIRTARHVITIDGVEFDANAAMVLVANCGEVIPPFVRLGPRHPPGRRRCST